MKPKHMLILTATACVILSAAACSLPFASPPTPFVFPTPDLTQTAMHNLIETLVVQTQSAQPATATQTSPPPPASATPLPTDTLPPTAATDTAIPPTPTTYAVATEPPPPSSGSVTRKAPTILAHYLQAEPNIDGTFDEWALPVYPVGNVVFGASNWSGVSDLSGSLMVAWDDYNLYLAVTVVDDVYAPNPSGRYLYQGDDIEVQLDTKLASDYYVQTLSADDYQVGVSPGSPDPGSGMQAYLWYPRSIEGYRNQVIAAATTTSDGYRVEVKIPWSVYNLTPIKDRHYGFAFSISDNDHTDQHLQQSMVSTNPYRMLTNPTTWNEFILVGQYYP